MKQAKSISYTFTPQSNLLSSFLKTFWFAPQDVLLRSVEASLFRKLSFTHPILDIGIGDASVAALFYPRKLIIDVGCDVDAVGIKRAQGNKKYKKILVQTAEKMTFTSGKFATVICNSTAEHISRDRTAIKEIGRVLKKGGMLHLTVPSAYLPGMIREFERFDGNPDPKKALKHYNHRVDHKHYHSLEEWKQILSQGKMELIFHKYYFPESSTRVWYHLMKFSTTTLFGREIWSWLGHSRFTPLIPVEWVIWYLENFKLKNAFIQSFETPSGAMLYLLARKK